MKRSLSVFLSILLILSVVAVLSACQTGPNTPQETESESESKNTTKESETKKNETESEKPAVITFTEATGVVYVNTAKLNYRSEPNLEDDSIAGTFDYGTELTKTGVSNTGDWIRITYEEKTYYVNAKYVTTEKYEETRLETPETVYCTANSLNVRVHPNFDDANMVIGGLTLGQAVTRVAISEEGKYSIILFTPDGGEEGEYYVGSRYLSTEKPEIPSETQGE
ncbi:MAG: SH3 domain-containing protein [Clostridia bacterium]|nr:SH3 domain-containing protein [Clostridia bacterium]